MGSEQRSSEEGEATRTGRGDAAATTSGQTPVDLDFVRGLIEAVDRSGIDSLEITRAGTRVKISKTPPAAAAAPIYAAPPAPAAPPAAPPAPPAPAAGGAASGAGAEGAGAGEAAAPAGKGLIEVKSPMVGTFYRAPAPGSKPFVEEGQRVKAGDVLCIIEAMKMLNQIESDKEGVVVAVLVENGQPVEFDQPLFIIE